MAWRVVKTPTGEVQINIWGPRDDLQICESDGTDEQVEWIDANVDLYELLIA